MKSGRSDTARSGRPFLFLFVFLLPLSRAAGYDITPMREVADGPMMCRIGPAVLFSHAEITIVSSPAG
jgi:hypothetical protein